MKTKSKGGPIPCCNTICDPYHFVSQAAGKNISGMQPGCRGKPNWVSGEKPLYSLPELAELLREHGIRDGTTHHGRRTWRGVKIALNVRRVNEFNYWDNEVD